MVGFGWQIVIDDFRCRWIIQVLVDISINQYLVDRADVKVAILISDTGGIVQVSIEGHDSFCDVVSILVDHRVDIAGPSASGIEDSIRAASQLPGIDHLGIDGNLKAFRQVQFFHRQIMCMNPGTREW